MARKPSERTNRIKPPEELNLTAFIDMITSLMFFLLIFAALIPVTVIDAPLPKIASTAEEVRKAKEPKETFDVTVWIEPTAFRIKAGSTSSRIEKKADGEYDFERLHNLLVSLKKQRPNSKEITLVPDDKVTYETMIQVMDASRDLVEGDEGHQQLPPEIAKGVESLQFNRLYPDVIIGGV